MLGNAEVAREMRVLDAGALRALAHPLRVEIYDILSQYGPQTASSLAARLGESSGSTSYHLRALAKHDLIREAEGRGSGRERWWERPPGSVTFANPEVDTHRAQAFVQASIEATQDIGGLASELGVLLSDAKDRLEAVAHATGSGSGQPKGIFTAIDAVSGSEISSDTAATIARAERIVELYQA